MKLKMREQFLCRLSQPHLPRNVRYANSIYVFHATFLRKGDFIKDEKKPRVSASETDDGTKKFSSQNIDVSSLLRTFPSHLLVTGTTFDLSSIYYQRHLIFD